MCFPTSGLIFPIVRRRLTTFVGGSQLSVGGSPRVVKQHRPHGGVSFSPCGPGGAHHVCPIERLGPPVACSGCPLASGRHKKAPPCRSIKRQRLRVSGMHAQDGDTACAACGMRACGHETRGESGEGVRRRSARANKRRRSNQRGSQRSAECGRLRSRTSRYARLSPARSSRGRSQRSHRRSTSALALRVSAAAELVRGNRSGVGPVAGGGGAALA